ncbi:MAG: nucleoside-diphosphate kinase [Elusimicrobia bacterium]|nr:nucleoside-diphosphate kinase [Elusimicrobiota bacterium]
MKQRTCVLIKPDGIEKKVIGQILTRFEDQGFQLLGMKMVPVNQEKLENFYSEHKGKTFYDHFLNFMLSGPIVATVWEGEDIILRSRQIIGATNSQEAEIGSLRNLYGTDNRKNLVHGSDSSISAEREIKIMFKESELCLNNSLDLNEPRQTKVP